MDIVALVHDAIPFLRNSSQAIRLSALHTYYSALPLTPKTTRLFQCFIHDMQNVPNITSSHPTWPAASVQVMEGHTEGVANVVFSPDGKKLASGSNDNTVQLWDVETGQAIGSALEGHTHWVTSVVFSPDGKKLASGSADKTVRLWDVETGQAIGLAFEGHTNWVTNVVFSPDGKKLASGSYDNTVQLWDVETGQAIGSALEGHTNWVTNVVFSPDGQMLASGSHDNTIRLWDIETGQAIQLALEGHTDMALNLTFSLDGKPTRSTIDSAVFADVQLCSAILSIDELGFLQHGKTRVLWLPTMLRGEIAGLPSVVAVGSQSGAISLIHWPVERSSMII